MVIASTCSVLRNWLLAMLFVFVWSNRSSAAELGQAVDTSTRMEAGAALDRGVQYLLEKQDRKTGSWSRHPGITAMCVIALIETAPAADMKGARGKAVAGGVRFILSQVQKDGRFGSDTSAAPSVYSTATCLLALRMVAGDTDPKVIASARTYLVNYLNAGTGIGYRADTLAYPRIATVHWALEALYTWTRAEDAVDIGKDKAAAAVFRNTLGQLRRYQVQKGKGVRPRDIGGFAYAPVVRRVKEKEPPTLWGSLGYAGVKGYLYCGLKVEDPRLDPALKWLGRNYTVKENAGHGDIALYAYYYLFSTTHTLLGHRTFNDGKRERNWRRDLVEELLSRQKGQGQWKNKTVQWLEGDPVLCTAYALLSMSYALDEGAKLDDEKREGVSPTF